MNMATLDPARLQDILDVIGMKQSEFINGLEEKYGLRKDTTRTWLRGVRNPRESAIKQIAAFLQVDPNDIIKDGKVEPVASATTSYVPTRTAAVPMLDINTTVHLQEGSNDEEVIRRLLVDTRGQQHEVIATGILENYFAIHISNGLYGSAVPQGSIVTWKYGENTLRDGSIAVVHQSFGMVYLRRVRFDGDRMNILDLTDEEYEYPRSLGDSERILGSVVKVEYNPQGENLVL